MNFNLMVMLHSITGSYGQLMIEVAYGETIFHSTEAVRKMVAQEEWLGCRHNASPMFDLPESTPMWAPYIYIFLFSRYKSLCICILFQNLYVV